MIESIEFSNYRALKSAKLPLGQCTLLLGPNGSGKSTAIRALQLIAEQAKRGFAGPSVFADKSPPQISDEDRSVGVPLSSPVQIVLRWVNGKLGHIVEFSLPLKDAAPSRLEGRIFSTVASSQDPRQIALDSLRGIRVFSLEPVKIAEPARLQPSAEIASDGSNLSVVLTQLQDKYPERFESLNEELGRWLPEFDRVLFDTGINGERVLMLRTENGKHSIQAKNLSHGVLLSLCIMSLSYLADPPTMVCLEEPDRGIHPRLLRQVHDAMVRLSNPNAYGDKRMPVQVLATTHSPYFLDLFRDHPEDVVISEKAEGESTFHRLVDLPHYKEIMDGAALGDAWYTGILGGVPVTP